MPAFDTQRTNDVDFAEPLADQREQLELKQRAAVASLKRAALTGIAVGVLGLFVYASHLGDIKKFAQCFSAGVLVSGAAAFAGVMLGFLFGIPRTSTQVAPSVSRAGKSTDAAIDGEAGQTSYAVNTNLEQISDWLTKILVGVGLTQLNEMPATLSSFAEWLGSVMPDNPHAGRIALGAIAYSSIFGFLFGYIWTRVVLSPLFRRADEQLLDTIVRMRQAETKATETVRRVEAQVNATVEKAHEQALAVVAAASKRAEELEQVTAVMLTRLYDPPELKGHEKAISLAENYLSAHGEPNSMMFWLRYACALAWRLRETGDGSVAHAETRDRAIYAARKVVKVAPQTGREWLKNLSHPSDREKQNGENDLEPLANDPAFQDLLTPTDAELSRAVP